MPDQIMTTPSPAAGSSKNYRPDNLVAAWIAHYHLSVHAPEMLDLCNRISTDVLDLITAQNDAIYAKVTDLLPTNKCVCDELGTDKCDLLWSHDNDLRQSIAKIFGKADAKPEERQG